MHSETFWNFLHAYWNIPDHSACIMEHAAYAFCNILVNSGTFWNILEYGSASILEHSGIWIWKHSGTFWNMDLQAFWNILEYGSESILEHSACILEHSARDVYGTSQVPQIQLIL